MTGVRERDKEESRGREGESAQVNREFKGKMKGYYRCQRGKKTVAWVAFMRGGEHG